jgi:hypothetical protein
MNCTKCQGLMVKEPMNDGFVRMHAWRCVNCGAVLDSVIGENKVRYTRRDRVSADAAQYVAHAAPAQPVGSDSATGPDARNFVKVVKIVNIVGPYCSTPADGTKINQLIQSLLNEGNTVELDFRGVKLVTSSFYRAAVGDLQYTFPKEFVDSHVKLSGLSASMTKGFEFLTAGLPQPDQEQVIDSV